MLDQLDKVAAGVIEDGDGDRPRFHRRLCERHAGRRKALELFLDIINKEEREGNSLVEERTLESLGGGICVWFQKEFERLTKAGVSFTQPPVEAGPVTIAIFNDTCGNLIQLIEQ